MVAGFIATTGASGGGAGFRGNGSAACWNSRTATRRGRYYTELFFLDEVTALAAGHRPCFECRRKDAKCFAECWQRARGLKRPPRAPEMDAVLHRERLDGRAKRRDRRPIDDLPDGAMIARGEGAFALRGDALLRWTPDGYSTREPRPHGVVVDVLTPPAMLAALRHGYTPRWHPGAFPAKAG